MSEKQCGVKWRKVLFGGWYAYCPKHGKIGNWHLKTEGMKKARCRNAGR